MADTMPHDEHAAALRHRKAARLADILRAHSATAASAALLPASGRLLVADLAGVLPPTETCWSEALARLPRR